MKTKNCLGCITIILLFCSGIFPLHAGAADMNDYCVTPPFIVGGVNPNLLLMIDNSASMFDLAYIDEGTLTRRPFYCYDKTYNYSFHYAGYFQDWYKFYEYDFANGYFFEVGSLPSSCDKRIPGTLCINGTNLDNDLKPKTITKFVAEGNYLNWLTASKFDIEKQVLTGGKYDPGASVLIQETRGCVGRRFLKEPIRQQTYTEGGVNTPLGLTFAVRGPSHPYSETLLSPGGQTFLEIYAGDYVETNCQKAVTDIINQENKNTITEDIELCLNYDSKGRYCSLDMFTSCKSDSDCAGTPGTCNIVPDGVCSTNSDGICSLTTNGVCTANNGVCSKKVCVGGGKAGASCNNNKDCQYSSCTVGKVGSLCSSNADCNVYTCTAGRVGNMCVANSDCNTKQCSAGRVGVPCTADADCNSGSGTCTSGNVGASCTTNAECAVGYKGVCQKPVTQQIKSTFGQSIHECYQYWNTGSLVGNNWLTMMTNPQGCSQIYKQLYTCRGGARDAKLCATNADCPGGECINGPEAIRQGSPILVCGIGYVGHCAGSSDNWQTTNWYAREYGSYEQCVKAKFEAFCGAAQVPPVTDPSDDPSSTEKYDNLPAIIGDMSVGAQLGDPIATLTLKLRQTNAPSGLIQEFENIIHFGAMKFNYFGTAAECPIHMPCEKICQTALTTCRIDADCPSGDTCVAATDLDGARIVDSGSKEGYILGRCSGSPTTTCANHEDCPSGQICRFAVGDHSSGLIKGINDIKASTWTPFSEGFYNAIGYFAQRTDLRLNNPDFVTESENSDYKKPIQYRCQKNNILLITDGMSTADLNPRVTSLAQSYNDGDGRIDTTASGTCPKYAGSRNLDDLAWLANHRNIRDFTETPLRTDPAINSKTIATHVVFSGVPSTDPGECNPETLLIETASNGGGSYQEAEDPGDLKRALREAFLLIAGRAASGTAASVLASGEGTGANLVQAIFYPERAFGSKEIRWTGSMKNLWYHIDPLLGHSTIREDSDTDKTLNLKNDYIINFFFDETDNLTKANLFADADGDGVKDSSTPVATPYFENVKSLWESGLRLWATSPTNRTIYTTTDEITRIPFSTASLASHSELIGLLGFPSGADAAAAKLINYVRGVDVTAKFCSNAFGTSCLTDADCPSGGSCIAKFCSSSVNVKCAADSHCPSGETCRDEYRSRTVTIGAASGTWKLGDIINSTPRISSWVPLNYYYKTYQDKSYKAYTEGADYQNRGMVFVGANDGMLHAFKLGYLKLFEEKYRKAKLCNSRDGSCSTDQIGTEKWAFIPKNALPYLRYMAEPSYCHLYSVDLTPYIFDASIGGDPDEDKPLNGSSWRTILIGGMRLGGACRDAAGGLGVGVPDTGKGYSSYFALDITNQDNPQLLWEFSNADIPSAELATGGLGFATTGPAVVRIAHPGDASHTKNGHWFVVFGSGPTGPIDPATHQFKAFSDQRLKLFVLDLKTGALLRTIDSGIPNAFAGSMFQASIDFDQNDPKKSGFYSDDALYFGFTRAEHNPPNATTKWNVGGVLRLFTKNDPDPDAWELSTVIGCDGSVSASECIGPVTSGIAKLQNYKDETVRLYFGTGRFFYRIADSIDDGDIRRRLYGVKEPCYSKSNSPYLDEECTTKVRWSDLGEAATEDGSDDPDGWYIVLDPSEGSLKAERNVTDPLSTPIGAVFFTTTKPSADVCEFGGASHLWAVKYDTGGKVGSSVLRGSALLQVSTGSIEEISLKGAFTQRNGRRTAAFQGVPPAGTPPGILIPPKPMNRIVHIREQ